MKRCKALSKYCRKSVPGRVVRLPVAFVVLAFLATAADAEPARRVPTVGWVTSGAGIQSPQFKAFKSEMRDLGWIEGRTVTFELRKANRQRHRVPSLFRALLDAKVDVIVSQGGAISGALELPGETPIVFGYSGDPISAGIVDSLAKPGGRFTGVSFMSFELNEKRLQIVREVLPDASRVGLLGNPRHPGEFIELRANRAAADRLGLQLHYAPVETSDDLAAAFESIHRAKAQAVIVLQDGFFTARLPRVIAFAKREGIPVISGWAEYARSGALFSYGPSRNEQYRRVAHYVDRILKGAKPGDLPIERPLRFELVINLQTAKTLGIAIPRSVLLRADDVVE